MLQWYVSQNGEQTDPGNHHLSENFAVWSKKLLVWPNSHDWVIVMNSDTIGSFY